MRQGGGRRSRPGTAFRYPISYRVARATGNARKLIQRGTGWAQTVSALAGIRVFLSVDLKTVGGRQLWGNAVPDP